MPEDRAEGAASTQLSRVPASEKLCKHFARGMCLFGAGCVFRHEMPPPKVRQLTAEQRAYEELSQEYARREEALRAMRRRGAPHEAMRAAATGLSELAARCKAARPPKPTSRYATRNRVRNKERAGALRRFLIDTYGIDALRRGPVLDIAGGQGALAFELVNLNGVDVTVVDPRPMGLRRLERKWERGLYFRCAPLQKYIDADVAAAHAGRAREASAARAATSDWHTARVATGATYRVPRHWRFMWRPSLWAEVLATGDDGGSAAEEAALRALEVEVEALSQEARDLKWTDKGLVSHEGDGGSDAGGSDDGDDGDDCGGDGDDGGEAAALPSAQEVFETLSKCSMAVGMHPDGATEAIVDFALARGVPFAVVPCCVYAAEFPRRVDATGRRVTSYDAFVRFLRAKAPDRIGVATLPFGGKNLVVYSLPEPQEGVACCAACD